MDLSTQLAAIGAHGETSEWRIFGPPGTGKTTSLGRQITRACEKHGANSVMVTSFSRAAAAELVGRDLPIPHEAVGTLHAHCFRALGKPPIAESKAAEWNAEYDYWRISGANDSDVDDVAVDKVQRGGDGDELLSLVNRWRNRKTPIEIWPDLEAVKFHKAWTAWKNAHGLMDFTDLIERAGQDCAYAPGNPSVIFADEAQDFTRLQLELVRRWGDHAQYYVVVGDDDQTIYSFTGATPDAFLTPEVPADHKIVLSQSYRVPRAVHAFATRWISRVSHREPKEYRPRDFDGSVAFSDDKWTEPDALIDEAEDHIAAGRSVMFLAACSYMLAPIRATLLDRGIPFHNPYRTNRGDWNPLRSTRGVSAAQRAMAYLKPHHWNGDDARPWTAEDLKKWAAWLQAEGTLNHGAKTAIKNPANPEDTVTMATLKALFEPEAYRTLMLNIMQGTVHGSLKWWQERVEKAHQQSASYPCLVATKHGLDALRARPSVVIGTIHSVKGGEADVVYLFPDLSAQGSRQWEGRNPEERDAIRRQFYVGMTRAKERLVMCEPAGSYHI